MGQTDRTTKTTRWDLGCGGVRESGPRGSLLIPDRRDFVRMSDQRWGLSLTASCILFALASLGPSFETFVVRGVASPTSGEGSAVAPQATLWTDEGRLAAAERCRCQTGVLLSGGARPLCVLDRLHVPDRMLCTSAGLRYLLSLYASRSSGLVVALQDILSVLDISTSAASENSEHVRICH